MSARHGAAILLLCLAAGLACAAGKNTKQCDAGAGDDSSAWSPAMQEYLAQTGALPAPDGNARTHALIDSVLAGSDFGGSHDQPRWTWDWRFHGTPAAPENPAANSLPARLLAWLAALSPAFGTLGHVLLWLLLLVLLVMIWRQRAALLALLPQREQPDEFVGGIDLLPLLAPDALPEDVVAAAQHLWDRAHPRDALGLLYRAALYRLGDRLAFAVPPSGTEQECLRLVRRHADATTTELFRHLVNAWTRSAWAHEQPADFGALLAAYRAIAATTGNAATAPGTVAAS